MAPVKESSKIGTKDGVAHGKVSKTTKRAGATIGSQQGAQKKHKQLLAAATTSPTRAAAHGGTTDGQAQAQAPPQSSSKAKRAHGSDVDSQKELPTKKQHLDNKQNPNGQKLPEENQTAATVGEKAPAKLDVQGSSDASKNPAQTATTLSRPSHHWRRTVFDSDDDLSDFGQRMRMLSRSARLKRKRVIESDHEDSDEEVRPPSSKARKVTGEAELVEPPKKVVKLSPVDIAEAARPWKEGDPPRITANLLKDTKFQKYKSATKPNPAATSSQLQSFNKHPAKSSKPTQGRTIQMGRGESWRPLRGPDAREEILRGTNQSRNGPAKDSGNQLTGPSQDARRTVLDDIPPSGAHKYSATNKRKAEGAHTDSARNKRQRIYEDRLMDSYVPAKPEGLSLETQRRNTQKRKEEKQAAQAAHAALLKHEMQSAAKKSKTNVKKSEAKAKQTDSNKISQLSDPEKGNVKPTKTVKSSKENTAAHINNRHHSKAPISTTDPAGSPLSKAVAKALSSPNEPTKAKSEGLADSGHPKPSTADVKPAEVAKSQQEITSTPPKSTNEECAAEPPTSTNPHHRESLDSGYASKSATDSPPDSKTLLPPSNSSAKYPIVPPFGFLSALPAPPLTTSANATQSKNPIAATDMGSKPSKLNITSTHEATKKKE